MAETTKGKIEPVEKLLKSMIQHHVQAAVAVQIWRAGKRAHADGAVRQVEWMPATQRNLDGVSLDDHHAFAESVLGILKSL